VPGEEMLDDDVPERPFRKGLSLYMDIFLSKIQAFSACMRSTNGLEVSAVVSSFAGKK